MVLVGLGGACSANADCAGGTYHHPKLKKALLMSGFRLIGVGVRIRHASHCRMSGRLASQRGCCVPRNYSRQVCQQGIGNRNVHQLLQYRHGPDVKGRRNSRCVHDPLHRAGLDDGRERQPHRRECRPHKQSYRRRGCDWGGQHQRCGEVGSRTRFSGHGPRGALLVTGNGLRTPPSSQYNPHVTIGTAPFPKTRIYERGTCRNKSHGMRCTLAAVLYCRLIQKRADQVCLLLLYALTLDAPSFNLQRHHLVERTRRCEASRGWREAATSGERDSGCRVNTNRRVYFYRRNQLDDRRHTHRHLLNSTCLHADPGADRDQDVDGTALSILACRLLFRYVELHS